MVKTCFIMMSFQQSKYGKNWFVEENALSHYLQERHILTDLRAKKY